MLTAPRKEAACFQPYQSPRSVLVGQSPTRQQGVPNTDITMQYVHRSECAREKALRSCSDAEENMFVFRQSEKNSPTRARRNAGNNAQHIGLVFPELEP